MRVDTKTKNNKKRLINNINNLIQQLSRQSTSWREMIFSFAVQNNSSVMWYPLAENQQTPYGSLLIHPSPLAFNL